MSCKICGRGACASWMHSADEQEKHDERESMTDNVDKLRREVQELRVEVANLKSENDEHEALNAVAEAARNALDSMPGCDHRGQISNSSEDSLIAALSKLQSIREQK